ncbi:MAG: hypothetical protein LC662_13795 [Rhodothermaceae bacterium]|nr:hypothetical protein [Rhodothermaceae bacterium]
MILNNRKETNNGYTGRLDRSARSIRERTRILPGASQLAATLTMAMLLIACSHQEVVPEAQRIIDRSIEVHGGDRYLSSEITFTFRDIDYLARRENGLFSYERRFTGEQGEIHDVYNNAGFTRSINGEPEPLDDEYAGRYRRSVNSVIYFALLPYALNDPAVRKNYLGRETIGNSDYHKIEVTFEQEGGGSDFEDVFIYWIHPETYTMDYLAYEFFTDGGGIRFREALNPGEIGGIRFADYNNYRPASETVTVYDTGVAFNEGRLEMVSVISLENVRVE